MTDALEAPADEEQDTAEEDSLFEEGAITLESPQPLEDDNQAPVL